MYLAFEVVCSMLQPRPDYEQMCNNMVLYRMLFHRTALLDEYGMESSVEAAG